MTSTAPSAPYAEKLTLSPTAMSEADIERLRAAGLDDVAIHDATQVISFFNYINRVADALGVEAETFIKPWGACLSGAIAPNAMPTTATAEDTEKSGRLAETRAHNFPGSRNGIVQAWPPKRRLLCALEPLGVLAGLSRHACPPVQFRHIID